MSGMGAGSGSISDPPGIPLWPPGHVYPVIQPPRTMPINVPFSNFGLTIVTMDRDGNITIKVEQGKPAE